MPAEALHDPPIDCPLCPRLVAFREHWKTQEPDWFNGPVPTWVGSVGSKSIKLLIIGMAPGLRGANRTGRPFTGDYAGDLLYGTLKKYGFASGEYGGEANDGLQLNQTAITNAVRCVPPENKPVATETNSCRSFLKATFVRFPELQVAITLGKLAHDSTVRALGERVAGNPFGHCVHHDTKPFSLISSYHCSRYNTNTGKLTTEMFERVFARAADIVQRKI